MRKSFFILAAVFSCAIASAQTKTGSAVPMPLGEDEFAYQMYKCDMRIDSGKKMMIGGGCVTAFGTGMCILSLNRIKHAEGYSTGSSTSLSIATSDVDRAQMLYSMSTVAIAAGVSIFGVGAVNFYVNSRKKAELKPSDSGVGVQLVF